MILLLYHHHGIFCCITPRDRSRSSKYIIWILTCRYDLYMLRKICTVLST